MSIAHISYIIALWATSTVIWNLEMSQITRFGANFWAKNLVGAIFSAFCDYDAGKSLNLWKISWPVANSGQQASEVGWGCLLEAGSTSDLQFEALSFSQLQQGNGQTQAKLPNTPTKLLSQNFHYSILFKSEIEFIFLNDAWNEPPKKLAQYFGIQKSSALPGFFSKEQNRVEFINRKIHII